MRIGEVTLRFLPPVKHSHEGVSDLHDVWMGPGGAANLLELLVCVREVAQAKPGLRGLKVHRIPEG